MVLAFSNFWTVIVAHLGSSASRSEHRAGHLLGFSLYRKDFLSAAYDANNERSGDAGLIRVSNIEALDRVDSGAFAPTHALNDSNIDSGASSYKHTYASRDIFRVIWFR